MNPDEFDPDEYDPDAGLPDHVRLGKYGWECDWTWVYEGFGNVTILSPRAKDGSFHQNGSTFYHFVKGSHRNETMKNKAAYDEVHVKMGLCKICFCAGPAGYLCPVPG